MHLVPKTLSQRWCREFQEAPSLSGQNRLGLRTQKYIYEQVESLGLRLYEANSSLLGEGNASMLPTKAASRVSVPVSQSMATVS